ncbi:MAG TPA: 30S ribosomal protein S16, partial [Bacteroidia bacterium]|nr:30S ribosomal protein S16 [Bacteroidia bacterium]
AILSYKGIMMRHHLYRGVEKGALTQEQADAKLAKWMEEKAAKVENKKSGLSDSAANAEKKRLQAEKAANEARLAKIAAKNAAPAAEETKAEAPAENTENA